MDERGGAGVGRAHRPLALDAALWGALGLALALRLTLWLHRGGPLWFEEDVPLAWAFRLWGFETGRFDPNPHSALWPHLSAYVFFGVQLVQYLIGRATGDFASPADFRAAAVLDPALLRSPAMLVAIAVGLAVVWAAARLAQRLAGRGPAAWVALALALDPIHLRHSLVISPDMLLTLFVLLGLSAALDVEARGKLSDSIRGGLWMGLGAACKYTPALLVLPLALAHARRPGGRRGLAVLGDRRLWVCVAVALAAAVLASPYTLVDLTRRFAEMKVGAAVLAVGPEGGGRHLSLVEDLTRVLPADLGWPLHLALLAAVGWSLARPTPGRWIVLAFLVPCVIAFGVVPTAFTRYLLPVIPLALVLGASAAADGLERPHWRRWVLAAGVLATLGLGWECSRFMAEYSRPDARSLARAWLLSNVPDGAVVATEQVGPELPRREEWEAALAAPGVPDRRRESAAQQRSFRVSTIPLSFPDPEIVAVFYDPRLYLAFDAVVVSSGVSDRYHADPARFPVQQDFYRALERFYAVAWRSPPKRDAAGPTLTVYRPLVARQAELEAWWTERATSHPPPRRVASAERVASTFAGRAQLFESAGRYHAAVEDWRRALVLPEAPADWWFQYGLCAEGVADWVEARSALSVAYRMDPGLAEAGLSWAEDAERIGRGEESARVLEEVLARGGLDADQRERAARLREALAHPRAGAARP